MRPAGLVSICNEIVHARRTSIVECGSGVSTIVLARLLRQRGTAGTVVALEHDPNWAQVVNDLLIQEGLSSYGRAIYAPLEGEPVWYSQDALSELPDTIDLLIVDGPPADLPGNGLRRAPALPTLKPRLSSTAAVYLDDIDRTGEQSVLEGWRAHTDWAFTMDAVTGTARGRRADAEPTPTAFRPELQPTARTPQRPRDQGHPRSLREASRQAWSWGNTSSPLLRRR
jgi:predicted O-methyltransferase YrrM